MGDHFRGEVMDVQQRFLRRRFLIESIEIFIRESVYHRTHHEAENTKGVPIWEWDNEEGNNVDPL